MHASEGAGSFRAALDALPLHSAKQCGAVLAAGIDRSHRRARSQFLVLLRQTVSFVDRRFCTCPLPERGSESGWRANGIRSRVPRALSEPNQGPNFPIMSSNVWRRRWSTNVSNAAGGGSSPGYSATRLSASLRNFFADQLRTSPTSKPSSVEEMSSGGPARSSRHCQMRSMMSMLMTGDFYFF